MREGAANYQADFTVEFALFWLVLVATVGPRTVEGAIVAAAALIFFPEVLSGLGLSASWQYILFGLGAIAYARHPEGTFEYSKYRSQTMIQQWLNRRGEHAPPERPAGAGGRADGNADAVTPPPIAGQPGATSTSATSTSAKPSGARTAT